MDQLNMRVFYALRRALFHQAEPFADAEGAPVVRGERRSHSVLSRIYLHGDFNLHDIASIITAEIRAKDRAPELVAETASAIAKAVIAEVKRSVSPEAAP